MPSVREFPSIFPDGRGRYWSTEYNPDAADGKGQIVVTLNGNSGTLDLEEGDQGDGTTFDRFGIVTSWIDGNSQDVYLDDLSYTISQE